MTLRGSFSLAVLLLLPGRALAHAFGAGQTGYELFLDGARLPFHAPELALSVIALGWLIGLWDREGIPAVWPFLAAGAAVGSILPWLVRFDPAVPLYVLALALGLLGAFGAAYARVGMRVMTCLAAGLIAYGALVEHGVGAIPLAVRVGLFAGLVFSVGAIAGLAALPLRRSAAAWPRIGLRVVASWLVAVTMMMMAFAVR